VCKLGKMHEAGDGLRGRCGSVGAGSHCNKHTARVSQKAAVSEEYALLKTAAESEGA
jgi:hypothetical protein